MTMVIITHKLWPWALLIFIIKALSLDFKVATGSASCYLGDNLDPNVSNSSIIFKERLYLLSDEMSCDGRITSIELCGVLIISDSIADALPRVSLQVSLYRNETNTLKRVIELVQLESRSSATFTMSNGVTCARISVVERNWTVLEGDILGVSFVNSSCEVLRFETVTFQTCPVYAAVTTTGSLDVVYFSENNSSRGIQLLDELSSVTNVKVNLQAFVEPLPPLYSDECDSEKASDPSRSESYFTGSGTYIMNDGLECSGYATSVSFCGALVNEREPFPQRSIYRFMLLHLRLSGDRYDVIDQEVVDYEMTDAATALNPICQSHDLSGWFVLQGDQLGVTLYAHCERSQSRQDNTDYCPIQIGLINTGCTDSSLFVTGTFVDESSSYYSEGSDSIQRSNTSKVAIKLNLDLHYDITDECQSQIPLHLRIIYGISVAFIVIIILLVVGSVLLMLRLKHTKPQVYDSVKRGIRQGSTRLRNSLSRSSRSSTTIHGLQNRSYSEQNEYSHNYNHSQANVQQRARIIQWSRHQVSLLSGTYEEPIDAIDRYERCGTDEDLYMEPPSKEMELKEQLQKIEVLKENIRLQEYLGSGRFGVVYRGLLTVTGVDCEIGVKEVAVKTMENGASEEDRVKFLQEAAIMGQFYNPYIVKIYGILTSSHPYMIICELMNKGDLRCYLNSVKVSGSQDGESDDISALLLNFSRQVASAMLYLSGKGYIHRDLAARNILVSLDRICKVSDFGLSRDLQDDDYYIAHGGLIPVRWTAPEALKQRKYSTASDVWSYGVVLFEIWSLASRPYGTRTNEQVLRQVLAGNRLPSPAGCPRAVYELMISCWHPQTVHRPTFAQLLDSLQQSDDVLMKWSEDEQTKYSENARTIGAIFQDGEVLHGTLQRTYLMPEAPK